jgi:hypothetical protein
MLPPRPLETARPWPLNFPYWVLPTALDLTPPPPPSAELVQELKAERVAAEKERQQLVAAVGAALKARETEFRKAVEVVVAAEGKRLGEEVSKAVASAVAKVGEQIKATTASTRVAVVAGTREGLKEELRAQGDAIAALFVARAGGEIQRAVGEAVGGLQGAILQAVAGAASAAAPCVCGGGGVDFNRVNVVELFKKKMSEGDVNGAFDLVLTTFDFD